MKKQTKQTKSLFSLEIENNEAAHMLSVLLNMVHLGVDIKTADLILQAIEKEKQLKGKFSIKDAVELRMKVEEKYSKIKDKFDNQ